MSEVESIRASHKLSPEAIVAELLALSIVEDSHTQEVAIRVGVAGRSGWIADTGRGMRLDPDEGDTMSHAERALTSIYPIQAASEAVHATLKKLVWGERGSLGPALPNAWCKTLTFTSHRQGEMWSQTYEHGVPTGPPRLQGPTDRHGTTMRFTVESSINIASVTQLIGALKRCIPKLDLSLAENR
ncbi:MAG: hypothetical protein GY946_08055 [bacterium]|nr:hypothetical protein [bacterium]